MRHVSSGDSLRELGVVTMKKFLCVFASLTILVASTSHAQTVELTGGESAATLFEDDLAAVGLFLGGFSSDVVENANGERVFLLNDRDAPVRPTTFEYTPFGNLGLLPVSGRAEHSGSVFFQPNLLDINSIGGLSIGFDANRESAVNSGFFIESTEGFIGIIFDIQGGVGFAFSDPSEVMFSGLLAISPEIEDLFPIPVNIAGTVVGTWSFNGTTGAGVAGDLNDDGVVDCADIDEYAGNIGSAATGNLAGLDLVADGSIDADDVSFLIENLVVTSNGQTGTFPGDLNCDGQVDVLDDAFILVSNLGNPVMSYAAGDINLDGVVNVLDDAFLLIANLGSSNG